MTPLIYLLETLDARVNISIIDAYASVFLVNGVPLYTVLADNDFIANYRAYNVRSVNVSIVQGVRNVYILVTQ